MTHRLERLILETTFGLRRDSPQMRDVGQSRLADLTAIKPFIPRQESHRLEVLIERLTGQRYGPDERQREMER